MNKIPNDKLAVGIILIFISLILGSFLGQSLWGITIVLIIVTLIVASMMIHNNEPTTNQFQVKFVGQVRAESNIFKVPSYFVGIPFFIVFGEMGSKYESIFSVEHEGEEITVIYPGICSVSKGDEVAISGILVSDKKGNIVGKCMKATSVEKRLQ